MQVGYTTLGDHLKDPVTGEYVSQAQRHRAIVEACVLAEQVGFDSVNLGEHHFCDYILSAPPVVLAAVAERTTHIRLSTAVTLAANNDPIRLAEDYSTLDLLSHGRAEIVAGRGNLYEHTFVAFGQDPRQSRQIFDEHVELLLAALRESPVHWKGGRRPPFENFTTQPRPFQATLPVWVGGGFSVDSAELAARLGLGLMLPSILHRPEHFAPTVARYRERYAEHGHPAEGCRVGVISHTNVHRESQTARRLMQARLGHYFGWVGELLAISTPRAAEKGGMPFDFDRLTAGPTICGSPAEVLDRIGHVHEVLGHDTHLLMFDMGGAPAAEVSAMVELAGAEVLPFLPDRTTE
ncbi:MAG: LLM class flavin-dependent oxidoreductase [Acidimicrobiales bacterium]